MQAKRNLGILINMKRTVFLVPKDRYDHIKRIAHALLKNQTSSSPIGGTILLPRHLVSFGFSLHLAFPIVALSFCYQQVMATLDLFVSPGEGGLPGMMSIESIEWTCSRLR